MKIKKYFEYDAAWDEIADEFTANDSAYQAQTINRIGGTFKNWIHNKTKSALYIQILEIAEDLDDGGKWFIETLYDYMNGKAESEDK